MSVFSKRGEEIQRLNCGGKVRLLCSGSGCLLFCQVPAPLSRKGWCPFPGLTLRVADPSALHILGPQSTLAGWIENPAPDTQVLLKYVHRKTGLAKKAMLFSSEGIQRPLHPRKPTRSVCGVKLTAFFCFLPVTLLLPCACDAHLTAA